MLDADNDQSSSRKRHRSDHGQAMPPESILKNPGPPPPGNTFFDGASGLDPGLIRELVNRQFSSSPQI
jgi:hypothetical protein